MSQHRQPRFKIHRVDRPHEMDETPYQAFWEIEGQTYRVAVWTESQWELMPMPIRPRDARALDGGWMLLRPIEAAWPVPHTPRESSELTPTESD